MPYRTPYGKHYHEEFGCHGATIPCDTKGLTPCSDCCGGKAGNKDTSTGAAIGGGAIRPAAADGGIPTFEPPRQDAPPVSDVLLMAQQDSPANDIGSYLSSVMTDQPFDPTGLAAPSFDGVPPMPGPAATIGQTGAFPPSMPAPDADLSVRIMDNGEIVRFRSDEKTTEQRAADAGNDLARKFDNQACLQGIGYESAARERLVPQIDAACLQYPEGHERETFRLTAQRTWNAMHPEASVYEWDRESPSYVADSKGAVLERHRNYHEMRAFNHGSNAIGYDYSLRSKVDGTDLTEPVAEANAACLRTQHAIGMLEETALRRAQAEVRQQENGLMQDWLSEKQSQSDAWRYHHPWSPSVVSDLRREFREETGYVSPSPEPRPTPEEFELLSQLHQRQVTARRELDRLMLDHDISEEMANQVVAETVWVPGAWVGEQGRRYPVPVGRGIE